MAIFLKAFLIAMGTCGTCGSGMAATVVLLLTAELVARFSWQQQRANNGRPWAHAAHQTHLDINWFGLVSASTIRNDYCLRYDQSCYEASKSIETNSPSIFVCQRIKDFFLQIDH